MRVMKHRHKSMSLTTPTETDGLKKEAVVDNGAVECVASRIRVPHLRVQDTPQSMRGEIRTCAGEKRSKGKAESHDRLDDGIMRVEKWSVQDTDGVPHMDQS